MGNGNDYDEFDNDPSVKNLADQLNSAKDSETNLIKDSDNNVIPGEVNQDDFSDDLEGYLSDEIPDVPSNDPLFRRLFKPVTNGSLRVTTLTLASITFGVGCLSFPQGIELVGLLPGILILLICGALTYWTLYILTLAARRERVMDYNLLTKKMLGEVMFKFGAINTIVLVFGALMAYEKAISNFSLTLLAKIPNFVDTTSNGTKAIQMAIFMIPAFLIGLLKDMSKLQYVGIVGGIALLYTALLIIIESFYYFKQNHPVKAIVLAQPIGLYYFDTISIFLFGFICHMGIFPVYKSMKRPNRRRLLKILGRAVTLEVVLYSLIALAGFFSLITDVKYPSIFITRADLISIGNDYFSIISMIMLICCLTGQGAVLYNLIRMSMKSMVFKGKELTFFQDALMTFIFYGVSNLLTFFVDDIVTIVGILGGFCAVNLCYVIPIKIYVSSNKFPKTHYRNIIAVAIMTMIVILGYSSSIYSMYKFIDSKIYPPPK